MGILNTRWSSVNLLLLALARRAIFIAAILGASSIVLIPELSSAESGSVISQPSTTTELQQRGKQLRVAIDKKYKELYDTHALTAVHVNTITPVVLQYIPIGTSFADAETILRAAGFNVGPHTGSHPLVKFAGGEEYDVWAMIRTYTNPYVDSGSIPYGTLVEIDLIPTRPMDYTKISKLFAAFGVFNNDPFP